MDLKIYHGKHKKRSFFEQWYFKQQTSEHTLIIVPSIKLNEIGIASASIEIIWDSQRYKVYYPYKQFWVSESKLNLLLGGNYFYDGGMNVRIDTKDLQLSVEFKFGKKYKLTNPIVNRMLASPRYMMKRRIYSIGHSVEGRIMINGKEWSFEQGVGTIEVIWGKKKEFNGVYSQANVVKDRVMALSFVAQSPLSNKNKWMDVEGIVKYGRREWNLSSWHGAKVKLLTKNYLKISQGNLVLRVRRIIPKDDTEVFVDNGKLYKIRYQLSIQDILIFDELCDYAIYEYRKCE